MIRTTSLTKRYGTRTVVDALTLEIAGGSVYGLLGPNGAGKSTTIAMLLGFVEPDDGHRELDGVDVAQDPSGARRAVGYVPESVALYPWLTARENLQLLSRLAEQPLTRADADALLTRVGVPTEAITRRVASYSKGMRQKVGIAVALAKRARVLLLDEPSSGLDPEAANELSTVIRDVAAGGVAVLMATHDIFRAAELCDRVGIMKLGRLVTEVSTASLTPLDLDALYLDRVATVAG